MSGLVIVPAAKWGRRPWGAKPETVPASARRYFVVHYDGGSPVTRTGYAIPRAVDDGHHAKGWAGIGYSFVVSQAGEVFEGRGWGLAGAHCPGRNTDGIGVQVAIGGDQQPTAAALAAVRALYDEACRRAGRTLTQTWHGAHYATECPGPALIGWVRRGMPGPQAAPTGQKKGDDVAHLDDDDLRAVADVLTGGRAPAEGGARYRVEAPDGRSLVLTEAVKEALAGQARVEGLLKQVLQRLPAAKT